MSVLGNFLQPVPRIVKLLNSSDDNGSNCFTHPPPEPGKNCLAVRSGTEYVAHHGAAKFNKLVVDLGNP